MPPSLLDSQFATLEPPSGDELFITLDISEAPDTLLAKILEDVK